MRTKTLLSAVSCLVLLAACSPQVEHQGGDAAPAGSPAQSPSASAAASPVPSATPSPSKPSNAPSPVGKLVLGPDGYGALRLGMTPQQAAATGLLGPVPSKPAQGCLLAKLQGAPGDRGYVMFSTAGLSVIDAFGAIATPAGVKVGTSGADMRKAYPDWTPVDGQGGNGRGYGKVPGNADAVYRIMVSGGVVTELTLQFKDNGCYE